MIIRKITTAAAVQRINPEARFGVSITADGVETYDWMGTTPIPQAEIDAAKLELQQEYDLLEYSRKRKDEYPDWREQLDKIYHDGIEKWKAEMIDPIKAKYPKP